MFTEWLPQVTLLPQDTTIQPWCLKQVCLYLEASQVTNCILVLGQGKLECVGKIELKLEGERNESKKYDELNFYYHSNHLVPGSVFFLTLCIP